MDLLDILKEKVEPGYLSGSKDVKETKVAKRVKIFTLQVQKGVQEMGVSYRKNDQP